MIALLPGREVDPEDLGVLADGAARADQAAGGGFEVFGPLKRSG